MTHKNFSITWPAEIADLSNQNVVPIVEASESGNPIDFVQNNPLDASLWIVGAFAAGLAIRSIVLRPK